MSCADRHRYRDGAPNCQPNSYGHPDLPDCNAFEHAHCNDSVSLHIHGDGRAHGDIAPYLDIHADRNRYCYSDSYHHVGADVCPGRYRDAPTTIVHSIADSCVEQWPTLPHTGKARARHGNCSAVLECLAP
jgi:hypothetical protein